MHHDYRPFDMEEFIRLNDERTRDASSRREESLRAESISGHPNVEPGEWRRIERVIRSPFWRAVHNLVAHPMLAIHRPLGERLHEYTAKRMYAGDGPGVVTDND